jgi:RecA/RadA recombinase
MAKKKKPQETIKATFSSLNTFLNTIAPDGEMIEDNPIAKIDEWIGTGYYILNAALSGSLFGGLPNRRSLGLAGDSGTGKTFIALSIARTAQKMGYNIIYMDSEGAIDVEFIKKLGVDPKLFRLQPVNTIEEVNFIASQINEQYDKMSQGKEDAPKVMIILDSLGNLSSTKEKQDSVDGSGKRDMTKQQEVRKLFRVNGMQFAKHGIPFIVNAHTYQTMSLFSSKEVSGGGGLKYNVSIMFMLGKGKLEDKEAEKKNQESNVDAVSSGVTVFVKPIKQRFAKPIKVQLHIPFYKAPNPYIGLEKFVSWENGGIMRGKLLTVKEFDKLSEGEQAKCHEIKDNTDNTKYAYPKDTARTLVVKHLGEIPLVELFTAKVFTEEVLRELDENVIKPTFTLPSVESLEDLAEITKDISFEEDENDI